jgi:hypothetical protein
MTTIVYTALRELTGLTDANDTATLEVLISEYSNSREVTKDAPRSKGGAREVLYHRVDKVHNITFAPVNGFTKDQLDEFLASTESGESFQIYLYGSEALPITVYRSDDGNQNNPFMQVGTSARDYWQTSITVTEV